MNHKAGALPQHVYHTKFFFFLLRFLSGLCTKCKKLDAYEVGEGGVVVGVLHVYRILVLSHY